MGCRFPRRACAFSDYAIYGVAICTNDQPGAIQKKRVVAGWQIGELQARRIARRLLRRDQRQPTITDDPPVLRSSLCRCKTGRVRESPL